MWEPDGDAMQGKPLVPPGLDFVGRPQLIARLPGRGGGRSLCDMMGGIASMVFAAQTLAAPGVELHGDLLVATNTDEESSGAGGTALVQRGLEADAGIVTEPTGFDTWVACRGSE